MQKLGTKVVFDECKKRGLKTVKDAYKIQEELKTTRPHLFGDPQNYKPIKSLSDVDDLGNNMAQGNYPAGMTCCEVVGINGDCGLNCPCLLDGNCDSDEMNEMLEEDDQ